MRLYGITEVDVAATIRDPRSSEPDERGNPRLVGETADGRPILVVVAADDPDFVITTFLFRVSMRADYDSTANAISITIADVQNADASDEVHPRAIVALAAGKPVEVQVLYPDLGIAEPLGVAAERYALDGQVLEAAAQSALAAPDRIVTLEVAEREPA